MPKRPVVRNRDPKLLEALRAKRNALASGRQRAAVKYAEGSGLGDGFDDMAEGLSGGLSEGLEGVGGVQGAIRAVLEKLGTKPSRRLCQKVGEILTMADKYGLENALRTLNIRDDQMRAAFQEAMKLLNPSASDTTHLETNTTTNPSPERPTDDVADGPPAHHVTKPVDAQRDAGEGKGAPHGGEGPPRVLRPPSLPPLPQ